MKVWNECKLNSVDLESIFLNKIKIGPRLTLSTGVRAAFEQVPENVWKSSKIFWNIWDSWKSKQIILNLWKS